MIRKGGLTVDEKLWTAAHMKLLKRAASYGQVERILVHPGIKKKLCDTVAGDRSWLKKIRPFWGHDYHFHIRIKCQAGSAGCKSQDAAARRRRLWQVARLVVHRRAVASQQESGRAESTRHNDDGEPAEAVSRRARGAGPGLGSGGHDRRQSQAAAPVRADEPPASRRFPSAPSLTSRSKIPLPKPRPTADAPAPVRPALVPLAQTVLGRRMSPTLRAPVPKPLRLALIAHDEKKADLVAFAQRHAAFLAAANSSPPALPASVSSTRAPARYRRMKSGPLGGDQQIGR